MASANARLIVPTPSALLLRVKFGIIGCAVEVVNGTLADEAGCGPAEINSFCSNCMTTYGSDAEPWSTASPLADMSLTVSIPRIEP
jgi:hypothetical protein